MQPIYVAKAGGLKWIRVSVILLTLASAVGSVLIALSGAAIQINALGVVLTASLWLVIPRHFEIWPGHLRVVFPSYGWDIPFETIAEVREAKRWEPYGLGGLVLPQRRREAVAIRRRSPRFLRRPNIVIYPEYRSEFLRELKQAFGRLSKGTQ